MEKDSGNGNKNAPAKTPRKRQHSKLLKLIMKQWKVDLILQSPENMNT